MSRLRLTLACGDYDRTRGLADGSIQPEGIELTYVALEPGELFERVARHREFPVAEMSLATYLNLRGRDDDGLVGIPVFPARSFRHGYSYVHRDAGINRPEDLVGKRVGTMQYQLTVNLWMRGILEEDHGVRPSDMTWVFGGQEVPGTRERAPVDIPDDVRVELVPKGRTLNELLLAGEIDALFAPHTPAVAREGHPEIVRLFPDYQAVEADWYRRTRMFPIMHLVVIRRDVYEADRWIARSLFKAFCEAKSAALRRLRFTGTLSTMVPGLVPALEAAEALFGDRYWPYGIEANRTELDTAVRWARRQGIARRDLDMPDLFAAETLDAVEPVA
jgi:ABC-type nitrate/sulfonate/bicarbonate transport system substrate-binding protein